VQAFFITLPAGGVGLNLTAADYVFLLDPWWNPAREDQAIARAHRIKAAAAGDGPALYSPRYDRRKNSRTPGAETEIGGRVV